MRIADIRRKPVVAAHVIEELLALAAAGPRSVKSLQASTKECNDPHRQAAP
jgi:hypothetical protein